MSVGDSCLWGADVEVTGGEADEFARRGFGRLVAREFVQPERTDCVLGDPGGRVRTWNRPGPDEN